MISSAHAAETAVQLGPRPFYLLDELDAGELKEKLNSCKSGPFAKSRWSIGHRGAPLRFPEHTKQSYVAAARMGAGTLECDVTFTKDRELVCRHAQNDLHVTTNILQTELASACSTGFSPATEGGSATAECRTSDITLAEFKTLNGKIPAANKAAKSIKEYVGGTAGGHPNQYSINGTLLTHAESIELFKSLGVRFIPELKKPVAEMPFEGPRAIPKCTSENGSVMSILPCGRARRWRESCRRRFAYASRLPPPDPR